MTLVCAFCRHGWNYFFSKGLKGWTPELDSHGKFSSSESSRESLKSRVVRWAWEDERMILQWTRKENRPQFTSILVSQQRVVQWQKRANRSSTMRNFNRSQRNSGTTHKWNNFLQAMLLHKPPLNLDATLKWGGGIPKGETHQNTDYFFFPEGWTLFIEEIDIFESWVNKKYKIKTQII